MDEVLEAWKRTPAVVGGVVVGHDGSGGADAALGWALDDAARRGCAVHVVRAWMLVTAIDDVGGPPGTVPSMQECADATVRLLEEDVAAVVEQRRAGAGEGASPARPGAGPDVAVTCHAVHGPSGPSLVAASARADLLVVGHRGRGHLVDLVIGSVAEYAVRHAACSVAVVRRRTGPSSPPAPDVEQAAARADGPPFAVRERRPPGLELDV